MSQPAEGFGQATHQVLGMEMAEGQFPKLLGPPSLSPSCQVGTHSYFPFLFPKRQLPRVKDSHHLQGSSPK